MAGSGGVPNGGGTPLEGIGAPELVSSDFSAKTDTPMWVSGLGKLALQGNGTTLTFEEPDQFAELGIPGVKALTSEGAFVGARRVEGTDAYGVLFMQVDAQSAPLDISGEVAWPNDFVVSRGGHVYFTQRKGSVASPADEASGNGVVHHLTPGKMDTGYEGVLNPNGIALSPDDKTLYVSGSSYADESKGGVWAYTVAADGSLSGGAQIASMKRPDGMCVDSAGNLYVTGATTKTIVVFSPEGEELGDISGLPGSLTNCGFGGSDLKTLYVTSNSALHRIQVVLPGYR